MDDGGVDWSIDRTVSGAINYKAGSCMEKCLSSQQRVNIVVLIVCLSELVVPIQAYLVENTDHLGDCSLL